jgi:prepilin-type processing-associated H-X9-DG protein
MARKMQVLSANAREFGFHSFHPGGAMFTMAGGSVQFIAETITPAVFADNYCRALTD